LYLPDNFFDWYKTKTGHSPSAEVLTHCRRELMHAIWKLMLDGEFLKACKHGIVIECPDGISRQFYFRVFMYSADYPEKYNFILSSLLLFIQLSTGFSSLPFATWESVRVPDA
jgi:hypothetical protein